MGEEGENLQKFIQTGAQATGMSFKNSLKLGDHLQY